MIKRWALNICVAKFLPESEKFLYTIKDERLTRCFFFFKFHLGNRGPLSVTIVQVGGNGSNVDSSGGGGGGGGTGDLLGLEPPSDLRPAASPLSDISATLHSDNNDTYTGGE